MDFLLLSEGGFGIDLGVGGAAAEGAGVPDDLRDRDDDDDDEDEGCVLERE